MQAMIIQSDGHNLDSDGSCFLTATGDLPKHDPLLGPLAFNGGPTETKALLLGGPAIDAGAAHGCPQYDQRGVARPQGAGCDIGAYEFTPPTTRSARARARAKRRDRTARRRARERPRTSDPSAAAQPRIVVSSSS